MQDFANDDEKLIRRAEQAAKERDAAGIGPLVGGLEAVIINTEPERWKDAAQELLDWTGLEFRGAFKTEALGAIVLKQEGSADFLVRYRKPGGPAVPNPFAPFNDRPKSGHMPNTRLETFVFRANDLEAYVAKQKERGLGFLTPDIQEAEGYRFIQTPPSAYTGNSLGFIQWKEEEGEYITEDTAVDGFSLEKPDRPYLADIHELDHTATRVAAEHRDDAIIEFMRYTGYDFQFAIYVESLNSITNVARLSSDDYAQVFTSGIKPFESLETSGPTERYIHNYGLRVHHMAFRTEDIDRVFASLKEEGMGFLVELVGSPGEGLKQTFTEMFPSTFLVNEYIHRYGDFDGFFTRSNVTELTRATEKQ